MRVRSLVALRREDYKTARECAERAHEVAVRFGNALLLADSNAAMALSLRGLGLDDVAEQRRERALSGYDSLGAKHFRARFERAWSRGAACRSTLSWTGRAQWQAHNVIEQAAGAGPTSGFAPLG